MIRIAISTEGATEHEFSQLILEPYFRKKCNISLISIPMCQVSPRYTSLARNKAIA